MDKKEELRQIMQNSYSNKLTKKKINPIFYSLFLFALSLIIKLLGFKDISLIFLYLFFISIFYGIYHTAKTVYNANKKGVQRLKNNQPFFDGSLIKEQEKTQTEEKKD